MKQSVLGQSCQSFQKKLYTRIGFCIAAAVLTLGLNILFATLRTDTNHNLFLAVNILSDIFCGFFLLYYSQQFIKPQMRLYRLSNHPTESFTGTVTYISPLAQRYMDLDCYCVTVNGRKVFLPVNTLELKLQTYTLSLVSNVIVEVEQ